MLFLLFLTYSFTYQLHTVLDVFVVCKKIFKNELQCTKPYFIRKMCAVVYKRLAKLRRPPEENNYTIFLHRQINNY